MSLKEPATKYQEFRQQFMNEVVAGRKPFRIKKNKLEQLCVRISREPVEPAIAKLVLLFVEVDNSDRCDEIFRQFALKLLHAQWDDYEFLYYMGDDRLDHLFIGDLDRNLFKMLLLVTLLGLTIERERVCGITDFAQAQRTRTQYWELQAALKIDGYSSYLDSQAQALWSTAAA